jgi:hypothetical protein
MALVDLGPPCARDWVALLGGHRIELVRKPLQHREAVRDEGRGVVDQALALEHNQDPAREVQSLGYCHLAQLMRLCRER